MTLYDLIEIINLGMLGAIILGLLIFSYISHEWVTDNPYFNDALKMNLINLFAFSLFSMIHLTFNIPINIYIGIAGLIFSLFIFFYCLGFYASELRYIFFYKEE